MEQWCLLGPNELRQILEEPVAFRLESSSDQLYGNSLLPYVCYSIFAYIRKSWHHCKQENLLHEPTGFSDMSLHHRCGENPHCLEAAKLCWPVWHPSLRVHWLSSPHLSFFDERVCIECAHLYIVKSIFLWKWGQGIVPLKQFTRTRA